MKCPLCKTSMIVVERHKVELDFCNTCRGIWFDAGELELLLDDMTGHDTHAVLGDILNLPPADCGEKTYKCPICGKPMQKVDIGKCGSLVVDACKSGHGLWFESGEVGCLVDQLGLTEDSKATKQDRLLFFVADTFRGDSRADNK